MTVALKGRLAEQPFATVFARISSEQKSGVLSLADIETKEVKKRIGFKSGRQAYVAGGNLNETLGRLLVKWGEITKEQFEKTLAYQKQHNKKTGEVLIGMKIMTPPKLGEALLRQTEEKILECFEWTDGLFSFVEAEPPADKQLMFFKINPERLLYEGIMNRTTNGTVQNLLAPASRSKFDRTAQIEQRSELFGFSPKEAKLLQSIKNGMTLPEILNASPLDGESTLKLVYILILGNLIQPDHVLQAPHAAHPAQPKAAPPPQAAPPPPPPPEPAPVEPQPEPAAAPQAAAPSIEVEGEDAGADSGPMFEIEGESEAAVKKAQEEAPKAAKAPTAAPKAPSKEELEKRKQIEEEIKKYDALCKSGTYFDLLGVDRNAKASDIKKAYFKLAKKFHPDTNPEFFKDEFKDMAEEIFTCIGQAYNTLNDQKARDEYVYALDHHISQEDIDRANRALEAEGIFVKAEVLMKKGDFRGALSMIDQAIKLHQDEPEFFLQRGWALYKSTKGAAIDEARKNIEKAINMNLREKLDEAHYYLGMLAKVQQLPRNEIMKHFQAAIDANPHHNMANSELRHLQMHKDKTPPPDSKKGGLFGRFKK